MPNSVIEAIALGIWDFEPDDMESDNFNSTKALPGTGEKLDVLAQRIKLGQPLWHPSDRQTYDDGRTD